MVVWSDLRLAAEEVRNVKLSRDRAGGYLSRGPYLEPVTSARTCMHVREFSRTVGRSENSSAAFAAVGWVNS